MSDVQQVMVQAIDIDGMPLAKPRVQTALAGRTLFQLQLARLDGGRALLAWQEQDETGAARIEALALDAALAPEGDPVQLSKAPVDNARFELGARALSAGVLYPVLEGGVRPSLKYRRIDAQGEASQAELNIVNAPGAARDGSITDFGQGYAVAYRALPSLGVNQPLIVVAFINQFGRIVHEAELSETSTTGGPTSLRATGDGHLLVGWATDHPSGSITHAIALDCPGALVLCGGAVP